MEPQTASEHNPEPARQHGQHAQRPHGPEQHLTNAAEDTNMVDAAEEGNSKNTQDLSTAQERHVGPDAGTATSHNCMQHSVHDAVPAVAEASRAAVDPHFMYMQQHSVAFLHHYTTKTVFHIAYHLTASLRQNVHTIPD